MAAGARLSGAVTTLLLLGLAACGTPSTPIVPTVNQPMPTATAQPSPVGASPTSLFFDGFKMVDARSGWAWKGISQLYRTDDGGATWTEIHLFGKMLTAGAFFLDRNEAWLPGVPDANITQAVFHTADGGKTWTALGQVRGPNLTLYFHDARVGWAMTSMGAAGNVLFRIYQTTNGGQAWTQLEPTSRGLYDQAPMPGSLQVETGGSLSFTPPETIWITSGYGSTTAYVGLTVSRDDGKTWQTLNPPLPAGLVTGQAPVVASAPQFMSDQDAYLPVTAGNRLVIFASHDGGATWKLLAPTLPAGSMPLRVQFVNLTDGFAACGTALCSTQDGGMSWTPILTPFSFEAASGGSFVSQFQFVDGKNGWAIVSDQNGPSLFVKTNDGGHTWMDVSPRLGF